MLLTLPVPPRSRELTHTSPRPVRISTCQQVNIAMHYNTGTVQYNKAIAATTCMSMTQLGQKTSHATTQAGATQRVPYARDRASVAGAVQGVRRCREMVLGSMLPGRTRVSTLLHPYGTSVFLTPKLERRTIGRVRRAEMGWDGKMFEPWPESANDRGDQDCDCDECGVSKRRKRSRCLLLPGSDEDAGSSIQPPPLAAPSLPAQSSAPTTPGAPSTNLAAEAESGREMGQAAAPAAAAGAAAGAAAETAPQLDEWAVEGARHLKPSAERFYAARVDRAPRASA